MPATPSAVIPDAKHNSEAWYASQIRAHLQSTKRYPTGREASLQRPSGTSVIWFIIRRNGELSDSGVETSSGSMLLDNAALSTVRRGAYPIFPEDIWPNKTQQRFTVELNFIPAS
jgi:protein TonB